MHSTRSSDTLVTQNSQGPAIGLEVLGAQLFPSLCTFQLPQGQSYIVCCPAFSVQTRKSWKCHVRAGPNRSKLAGSSCTDQKKQGHVEGCLAISLLGAHPCECWSFRNNLASSCHSPCVARGTHPSIEGSGAQVESLISYFCFNMDHPQWLDRSISLLPGNWLLQGRSPYLSYTPQDGNLVLDTDQKTHRPNESTLLPMVFCSVFGLSSNAEPLPEVEESPRLSDEQPTNNPGF